MDLNLDAPVLSQYAGYLADLARGDFGVSFATKRPISADLRSFLPATLELALVATALAMALGIPAGVMAADRAHRLGDTGIRLVAVTGVSMPVFWSALILQLFLASKLGWLPLAGRIDSATQFAEPTGFYLIDLRGRARRDVRRRIRMVAQNPLLSLSPRRRIAAQIAEPLLVHTRLDRTQRSARVDEIIAALDLSPAVRDRFPHEFSGGQAQRVVLARALVTEPSLILFDEPTSALDVSVQAGVLNLLLRLKAERCLTYLFITHDLGVARHLADRIAVMHDGELVEQQPTEDLFATPRHLYTRALLASSLTL